MPNTLSLVSIAAAGLAATCLVSSAQAQGALKPLEALVVNPESRPVPVADKALLDAARAILDATRAAGKPVAPVPYQQTLRTLTCEFAFQCIATFAPVPAGKRLVVTHVSGAFAVPTGTLALVVFTSSAAQSARLVMPVPQSFGPSTLVTSSPLTYHVDAGAAPRVEVNGASSVGNSTVTVVGHLVDAP